MIRILLVLRKVVKIFKILITIKFNKPKITTFHSKIPLLNNDYNILKMNNKAEK